ncbi:MAG: hypothetical protein IMW91_01510 [Firmicutes bacterium]|nr:hypothetical protein [Bacillota bacterium]
MINRGPSPLRLRPSRLRRMREIANVLAQNGFAFLREETGFGRFVPHRRHAEEEVLSRGERVLRVFEQLGPTFIKMGQVLSTRRDLIPPDIADALTQLQDSVPPFPFEEALQLIKEELGAPAERIFARISAQPLAAASLGQVHEAWLLDGTHVVIKVQRPEIQPQIEADLGVLAFLAGVLEQRSESFDIYRPTEIVEELARTLHEELDYRQEAHNAELLASKNRQRPWFIIPDVYWEQTSRRVLTLSFEEGVKVTDRAALQRLGIDLQQVARRLTQGIVQQIFLDGLFHADPHPGNLLITSENRIVLLDFGMIGWLSDDMRQQFGELAIGMVQRDSDRITRAVLAMGIVPQSVDRKLLFRDVDTIRQRYVEVPLSEIDLSETITLLFQVAYRHHIRIPANFSLLARALVTLQGVVNVLDPTLNMLTIAEPIGRRLLLERLDPRYEWHQLELALRETRDLLRALPDELHDVWAITEGGALNVRIAQRRRDEEKWMQHLSRMVNRLSTAMVFIGFALLCVGTAAVLVFSGNVHWRFGEILLGLFSAGAIGSGTWLLWGIGRSGRL